MKAPDGCQVTECGKSPEGHRVLAVTDMMGPQAIVRGEGVHLLSPRFPTHQHAVYKAQEVASHGLSRCEGWTDLLSEEGESFQFTNILYAAAAGAGR